MPATFEQAARAAGRLLLSLLAVLFVHATAACSDADSDADMGATMERHHAHTVFFSLADKSESARAELVEACKEYLSGHDGTVSFYVGTRMEEMTRDVNVRDFDVALHIVFENKSAHDAYQKHPRHLEFVEEHESSWENVRVFDSSVW